MSDSSPTPEQHAACDFDAHKLLLKLSVTLCADRKAVDPVVQSVMNVVREMKCAAGREEDIELALTEALANAVIHGASSDPTKIVASVNWVTMWTSNVIIVTIGNIVGGLFFVGVLYWVAFRKEIAALK